MVDNVKWYGRANVRKRVGQGGGVEMVKPRGVSESKSNRFQVLSRDCRDVLQSDQAFSVIGRPTELCKKGIGNERAVH